MQYVGVRFNQRGMSTNTILKIIPRQIHGCAV